MYRHWVGIFELDWGLGMGDKRRQTDRGMANRRHTDNSLTKPFASNKASRNPLSISSPGQVQGSHRILPAPAGPPGVMRISNLLCILSFSRFRRYVLDRDHVRRVRRLFLS